MLTINMGRTNGRTSKQINNDSKHYINCDRSNSGLEIKKKDFKTHPYHNHSYTKFCEHRSSISGNFRSSISGNYKSIKPRSPENRLAYFTSERKANKQFVASFRSFEHSLVNKWSSDHVSDKHGSIDYRSAVYRLTDHGTADHISVDIHSSANDRTTDHNLAKFPSEDDIAKCLVMKVYSVIEPTLKKILHCICKDKEESDTLELYGVKGGMDSKWLKQFSEEQIKNIRLSPDFDGFDSTLIFRCIEVFRDFNPILMKHENLKLHIDNTMKELKSQRNLLCHNRKNLTAKHCHDAANNLKELLEDLLEIIHIWDRGMNVNNEKMKICEEIRAVMNGSLSESEFRYMRLLKVINCIAEPVLSKVTLFICNDKQGKENFKEYFKRKGMNARTYKDTFFKEEKDILESNSEEVQPDLTLHCKIIVACKKWHPSLNVNENVTNEFSKIIRQIRCVRNHTIHNMLAMSSNECDEKAKELGDSLKNLLNLVNIIQSKKLEMIVDAAKFSTNQINSDINCIMSMPYNSL